MKIDEKVEEIIKYLLEPDFGGGTAMEMLGFDKKEYAIAELLELIQEERADAIKKFVEWVDKDENRGFEDPIRLIQADRYLKTLESEDR